jgi:galactokinase
MDLKEQLLRTFSEKFGAEKPMIVRSPGRVNIIGEHTDYNNGFVLPGAIDKSAWLAISLRADEEIHLWADDFGEAYSTKFSDLHPVKQPNWPNYLLGPVAQFQKKGIDLKGFNAVLKSDLPIGAGLSSSAAVECAMVFALDKLMGSGLDQLTMIRMAQLSEHEFAGVMCGIMDQFASMMGKRDHVMKLDCRSLEYEQIPFALEGLKIVLLNTNVKHSLASSEYNTRREECEQGVAWISEQVPGISSLRDVTMTMLDEFVKPKSELVHRRCSFVLEENERLEQGCKDLQRGDINSLGKKMFGSHEGLRRKYEVSCRELDWLVEQVAKESSVIGARMMGGGFGGCTINLVKDVAIEPLISDIQLRYEAFFGLPLTHYIARIGNGTELC